MRFAVHHRLLLAPPVNAGNCATDRRTGCMAHVHVRVFQTTGCRDPAAIATCDDGCTHSNEACDYPICRRPGIKPTTCKLRIAAPRC